MTIKELLEKITPGEWRARGPSKPDNTGGCDWCVLDDDGKILAETFEHVGFSDDRKSYSIRPAEANAELISLAPALARSHEAALVIIRGFVKAHIRTAKSAASEYQYCTFCGGGATFNDVHNPHCLAKEAEDWLAEAEKVSQ